MKNNDIQIYDLEQTDPVRIKLERDLLAQAIAQMAIGVKLYKPDAVLTGPHLIMVCEDITEILNKGEQQ